MQNATIGSFTNTTKTMFLLLSSLLGTAALVSHFEVEADYNVVSSTTSSLLPVNYSEYFDSTTSSGNDSDFKSYQFTPTWINVSSNPSGAVTLRPVVDVRTLWQYRNGIAIFKYGSPILLFLATVGNTMSVITLQHPTFRKSSTSFILSALAIVDMLYVDVGLMRQWTLQKTLY